MLVLFKLCKNVSPDTGVSNLIWKNMEKTKCVVYWFDCALWSQERLTEKRTQSGFSIFLKLPKWTKWWTESFSRVSEQMNAEGLMIHMNTPLTYQQTWPELLMLLITILFVIHFISGVGDSGPSPTCKSTNVSFLLATMFYLHHYFTLYPGASLSDHIYFHYIFRLSVGLSVSSSWTLYLRRKVIQFGTIVQLESRMNLFKFGQRSLFLAINQKSLAIHCDIIVFCSKAFLVVTHHHNSRAEAQIVSMFLICSDTKFMTLILLSDLTLFWL